jgi:hypothetical protein
MISMAKEFKVYSRHTQTAGRTVQVKTRDRWNTESSYNRMHECKVKNRNEDESKNIMSTSFKNFRNIIKYKRMSMYVFIFRRWVQQGWKIKYFVTYGNFGYPKRHT